MIHEIDINSDEITSLQTKIKSTQKICFQNDMNIITKKFSKTIKNTILFISKLDFYVSNSKTASLYGYIKPIIDKKEYGYIECNQLRHPIIERLIEHEYIAHDISIGNSELKGILLYGLNSSGKS